MKSVKNDLFTVKVITFKKLKYDEYIKNNHVPNKYCTYRRFYTVLQQWETKSNNKSKNITSA